MKRPAATVRSRSARILKDATPQQLDQSVALNQREWIRFQGNLANVELHDDADVTWICSSQPGRPNTVVMAHFESSRADRRIRTILNRYKLLDAATVWWVGPGSSPPDLSRRLRDAGFRCFKHFPGMVLDMTRIKRKFPAPRGLKIELLHDFSIFHDHEHPFIGPITTERRKNKLEAEQMLCAIRPQAAFAYIATLESRPVGHAMTFLAAGVAGVYDVGVVKRARRKGIGTAVTVAAVEHAQSLGYRYAVLKASGEGEGVYRRIGFEEACRVSLWFHSRRHHEGA